MAAICDDTCYETIKTEGQTPALDCLDWLIEHPEVMVSGWPQSRDQLLDLLRGLDNEMEDYLADQDARGRCRRCGAELGDCDH